MNPDPRILTAEQLEEKLQSVHPDYQTEECGQCRDLVAVKAHIDALQAQRDSALAKSRAIVDELNDQMDGSLVGLKVDILGMAFYRHTGIWPLFKSEPPYMRHDLSDEQRSEAYGEWLRSATGRTSAKETFTQ